MLLIYLQVALVLQVEVAEQGTIPTTHIIIITITVGITMIITIIIATAVGTMIGIQAGAVMTGIPATQTGIQTGDQKMEVSHCDASIFNFSHRFFIPGRYNITW